MILSSGLKSRPVIILGIFHQMMKGATALLLAIALAACAGTRFSFDNARKLNVGMTERQVTDIMGRPYNVSVRGDLTILTWVFVNGFTGANRSLALPFKDGKLSDAPKIPEGF